MDLTSLLVLGLATQRALYLWFNSRLFVWPRQTLLKLKIGGLTECPMCLSVWIAAGLGLAWMYVPHGAWLAYGLAVSTLAGPLHGIISFYESFSPPVQYESRIVTMEAKIADLIRRMHKVDPP